jgi:hypothetical protein
MTDAAAAQEIEFWKMVSEDLKIDIVTPFEIVFSDGARLRVAALVKNFGPERGMLVASDYETLRPYVQKILEYGYGYSAQLGNSLRGYDRDTMLAVLKDWGWSGSEDQHPSWLD